MESRLNTVVAVGNLEVATNDTPSVVVKSTDATVRMTPTVEGKRTISSRRGSSPVAPSCPSILLGVNDVMFT